MTGTPTFTSNAGAHFPPADLSASDRHLELVDVVGPCPCGDTDGMWCSVPGCPYILPGRDDGLVTLMGQDGVPRTRCEDGIWRTDAELDDYIRPPTPPRSNTGSDRPTTKWGPFLVGAALGFVAGFWAAIGVFAVLVRQATYG